MRATNPSSAGSGHLLTVIVMCLWLPVGCSDTGATATDAALHDAGAADTPETTDVATTHADVGAADAPDAATCNPDTASSCNGTILTYCDESGMINVVDCSADGLVCAYSDIFGDDACVLPGSGGGQQSPNEGQAHFLGYPLTFAVPVQNGWQYARPPNDAGQYHRAIDFGDYNQSSTVTVALIGSSVLSPCDGYAMTSTQYASGTGYGRFVLVRCDQRQMSDGRHYFVVLAHLGSAAAGIPPFVDRFTGIAKCLDVATNAHCAQTWARVDQGIVVATVGKEDTAWYHLHVEVFVGDYTSKQNNRRDPYDLYKKTTGTDSAEHYYNQGDPLWGGCGDNYLWQACPPQGVACAPNFCQDHGYASGSYCDGTSAVVCGLSGSCKIVVSSTACGGGQVCSGGGCACDGSHPVSCSGFCCAAGQVCGATTCQAPTCPGGGICSGHGSCNGGTCTCDPGYSGTACDGCAGGYSGYPRCCALNFCHDNAFSAGSHCNGSSVVTCGVDSKTCEIVTGTTPCGTGQTCSGGACVCDGAHAVNCSTYCCNLGQTCGTGTCVTPTCPGGGTCSDHGNCNGSTCTCSPGYAAPACDQCDVGYSGYPVCCASNFCHDHSYSSGTHCNGMSRVTCGLDLGGCEIVTGTAACGAGQTCSGGSCVCDGAHPVGCTGFCCAAGQCCNGASCSSGASYYRDADGDGYGDPNVGISACSQPGGYVANNTDCDDTDGAIYPGAPDLCDLKVNDCNASAGDSGCGLHVRRWRECTSHHWHSHNASDSMSCPPEPTLPAAGCGACALSSRWCPVTGSNLNTCWVDDESGAQPYKRFWTYPAPAASAPVVWRLLYHCYDSTTGRNYYQTTACPGGQSGTPPTLGYLSDRSYPLPNPAHTAAVQVSQCCWQPGSGGPDCFLTWDTNECTALPGLVGPTALGWAWP